MTVRRDIVSFLRRCRLLDDFVALDDASPWRLGGVLYARCGSDIAVIQKAARSGYGFSDQWALPGGMIRASNELDGGEIDIAKAVARRVRKESGLPVRHPRLVESLGPIVTAYNAAGADRLTLIAVFIEPQEAASTLMPNDHNIQAACWAAADAPLKFAPGNTLILAHLLWAELDAAARQARIPSILSALDVCSEAAAAAGIAPPVAPWDPPEAILTWSQSWPGSGCH